ncbi:MAG: hypothetical protein NTW38_01700 [Candidatus Aminicenantes bacterium]|nr:hypothetical protein [Candidatus Aminicenantes bacterium]
MFKAYRKYPCPKWYDLFVTCHTHGWVNLAPFSWDKKHSRLEFALLIDSQAVDVSIQQDERSISGVICSKKKIESNSLKRIDAVLARILGLKEETTGLFKIALKIGDPYPGLVRKGAGRLLRGVTLWEDAAKTLFTTNCSWALTQKMCEKICSADYSAPAPSGRFPFPLASALADERLDDLRRRIPIGYRAVALKQLARSFSNDSGPASLENATLPYDVAYEMAVRLRGFGPYAAAHLLILAGYYDRIPVDSEVNSYIKKNFRCRNVTSFVHRHYRPWGKYKWWGLKFEKMLRRQNWLGD